MSMKIYSQWRPGTIIRDFWLVDDSRYGKAHQLVMTGEGRWERREIDREGDALPPSFSFPQDVVEALADELNGSTSPSTAQARHLDDVIKVRDRLFSMLEKKR